MTKARVDLDWSEVHAGCRHLVDGIESGSLRAARDVATETADAIRSRVPVLTGALAATVEVVDDSQGAAVAYGGDLPYAGYIERRSGAVAQGVAGAAERFTRAEVEMAEQEVRKL